MRGGMTSFEQDAALLTIFAKSGWEIHVDIGAKTGRFVLSGKGCTDEPRTIQHESITGLFAELVKLISERLT
jgi:hypothetical protein